MTAENDDVVSRPKRTPNKKTNWEKSDKLNHGKRTQHKRQLAEIDEDEDDWRDYINR